jgi:hypothetical protein
MGMGGQHHAPAALPPGKTRYPFYRRLGGPQGRSGRMRKFSSQHGFDHRTVQPVASCYTDWSLHALTNSKYCYWKPRLSVCRSVCLYNVHWSGCISSEYEKLLPWCGGTAIQAERSLVRFPTVSLKFYIDSASNRNEYQEHFMGGKGGRCVGLTTLPPSRADCLETWEPQPPGTLRGLSRRVMWLLHPFTVFMYVHGYRRTVSVLNCRILYCQ